MIRISEHDPTICNWCIPQHYYKKPSVKSLELPLDFQRIYLNLEILIIIKFSIILPITNKLFKPHEILMLTYHSPLAQKLRSSVNSVKTIRYNLLSELLPLPSPPPSAYIQQFLHFHFYIPNISHLIFSTFEKPSAEFAELRPSSVIKLYTSPTD